MEIKNKQQSIEKIIKLGLNRCPEKSFKDKDIDGVLDFFNLYNEEYYCIRSSIAMGKSYVGSKQEILEIAKNYNHDFSICVSLKSYGERLLTAEVCWKEATNDFYIVATKNPYALNKDLQGSPDFNLKTDIFDKKLNSIPGIGLIFDLIQKNNLFNMIVECAIFDRDVGVDKSKIIIYELRSHY